MPQDDASGSRLADCADDILGNPGRRAAMAAAMGALARADATRAVVDELTAIARKRR
jgi:hypothetical protein